MRTSYTEGELLTKDDIGLVFKCLNDEEYRIVCVCTNGVTVIAVNKEGNYFLQFNGNGKINYKGSDEYDLVSFVGPNFTENKPLRKFEFEANICAVHDREFITLKNINGKIFNKEIVKIKFLCDEFPYIENDKKYKITMEELPNEN